MKVSINVECTPEEARGFLGLPDVRPVNELLVQSVADTMKSQIDLMDPGQLMSNWMSLGGRMTDTFWTMMSLSGDASAFGTPSTEAKKKT